MLRSTPRLGIVLGLVSVGVAIIIAGIFLRRPEAERVGGDSMPSLISGSIAWAQGNENSSHSEALALWKRTLRTQTTLPLRARATITRWSASGELGTQQIVNIVEGSEGRYRFTYIAPASVRGRVVVNDGKFVYHYEPDRQTVLRRPTPPINDLLIGNSAEYSSHLVRILPKRETIAGRNVRVLELRGTQNNELCERRWVDEKTGRSLRIEEYRKGGETSRRVELTQVAFTPPAGLDTFQANFPHSARVLNATARQEPIPVNAARLLGLPGNVRGYQLRSVVLGHTTNKNKDGATPHEPRPHHLIYSNGIHAISVFATEITKEAHNLRPAAGWQSTALLPGVVGYTMGQNSEGHSAVAWTRFGRRYVVVGRIPHERLILLSQDLARGADQGN